MASLLSVIVDCVDPRRAAQFWAEVLGAHVVERNPSEFTVRDDDCSFTPLYFMAVPEPNRGKNRLHLDVLTDGPLEAEVARLDALGARLVEYRQDPDSHANPDRWAVLEDPEGHVFCSTSTATLSGWP
jgi:catechol 2,3-dioxygenase-like lactoylglutathione lyase family enzyme